MIYNKTKSKSKVLATLVAIFMLFSNLSVAIFSIKTFNEKVFAYQSTISVANANFASPNISNSTTLPASPSSWNAKNGDDDVTAGIITLDAEIATDEKIQNNYKLDSLIPTYTGMSDKQVLMINSKSSQASAGYASSAISMSKSSYYVIEFMAYTESAAHASAKLSGSEEIEKNVLQIISNGAWKNYRIYVATSSLNALSSSLELWLGVEGKSKSAGAVFFDNVTVTNYDNSTFFASLNNETNNYLFVNLDDNYETNFVSNADFELPLGGDNWQIMQGSMVGANNTINGIVNIANFNGDDANITDEIKNTNVYGNQNALLIKNVKNGFVGYQSGYFTVKRNGLYKLSFLVKTNIESGNASVNLVERNPYTNELLSDGTPNPNFYANSSYKAQTFTISSINSSDYTNEITNDWKTYSFYIKGNNLIDTEMNLELMLGNKENGAVGYIFFDHFTLENITSNQYTSNVSDGTEANLNQYNSNNGFANAAFNQITIENTSDTYPYTPESWTLTTKNNLGSVLNGVVNTSFDGAGLGIPSIESINNKYTNNNVLMIGNISSNNQKYKSQSVSLPTDSYAKITVDVLTTNLNIVKAGIRLVDASNNVLGEIMNIDTNGKWTTYTLLVKTGYESKTVNIELSLGENAEGTGYAFFDNVIYTDDLTEDDYTKDTDSKKIDLSKYNFSNIPLVSTETQGVYAPYDFTASNVGGENDGAITSGIIDTAKYGETDGYNESSFENPSHPTDENNYVLMIKSTEDVYYIYKNNVSSSLTSGNYYQIDVKVKTDNLRQDEENIKYSDDKQKNAYPYGASINIDGIDASFTGIDTDGEWKTYTVYINCTTTSDINIELGLGSKNAFTKGAVYFSSLSITKIDESAYTDGIRVLESDNTIDNVLAIGNTDTVNDDDNKESSTNSGVNFDWLLIPSLVFGITIVFAVVMVIIRQTKRKSHKKVKVQKAYSQENFKKLADSHKIVLRELNNSKRQLIKKQNALAEQINQEKLKDNEKSKANVEKLQKDYDELDKKLVEIESRKADENKKYKQKINELKAIKQADEEKKK